MRYKGSTKQCGKCKEVLTLVDFHKSSSNPDGYVNRCKQCVSDSHRLRKYGLNREDYVAMYNTLEGACPLCNKWYEDLAVDHDHTTGKIRGLLCISCNRVLGYLENSTWVTRAKAYLSAIPIQD